MNGWVDRDRQEEGDGEKERVCKTQTAREAERVTDTEGVGMISY